ncbi:GntR family transcriptional regulator/MocR family aminotransferase [Amycolatopsis bartoniae]|uniref:GntR family transcriptional regulator n=1 Tax=Amycolatopsis bartoniae TaxID=941986 RepID=A0A8H9M9A6_9PSEU|nr:PLP-dependent aminotransferase family protein [Amycolatopsis bartoniae]MBB2934368.1 GntR family transcriptional regulator/MocR family aminotransferase [Amycolatopsis bartoniae]TVS99946.1 PLP-dependent aminotransferase family protein [Amycolatopsis bartoniae]GHF47854.1 GntR family transcriptional regulator [Amycolatopsis bartoniae]
MADSWSSSWDVHLDWHPGSGRQGLADALRRAIREGRLSPGAVVPSTRALAKDLGVARGTVTRVYADLTAEGYLRTSQGAPTRVAAVTPAAPAKEGPRAAPWVPKLRWDLYPGRPDLSSFPRDAWISATRRVLQSSPASVFDYGDVRGPAVLREALARYLSRSRGVLAEPERIVVCGGFSHALTVLAHVLPGELAFEDPSLPEFRDLAARCGMRVTGVPVDEAGLRVSELDSPTVVVTPAHQYPLGTTLAPERRTALARWATEGGLVIEDDYDGEFRFDRQPVGALQALSPERIVYTGTVSKTLAPAVRIGWLVLPRALVEPARAALATTGWRPPVLDHLVLAEMLNSGAYDRHVRQRRIGYRNRRDRLLTILPEDFRPVGISAGLHLLLMLPAGVREDEVVRAATRESVAVDFLGRHWIAEGDHPQGLVLGYATPAEHAFGPAIDALMRALTP